MRRLSVMAGILGLVTGLLLALGTGPSSATFPGKNGLIAFNRAGNVYAYNLATKVTKQITTGGGFSGARWSPDGKQLAYKKGGGVFVRTMSTGKVVTVGSGATSGPFWSGDGTRVAWLAYMPFTDDVYCGEQGIYAAPKTGGSAPALLWGTGPSLNDSWDYCAGTGHFPYLGTWSPDSKTILATFCDGSHGGEGCTMGAIDLANASAGPTAFHTVFGITCDYNSEDPPDPTCVTPKESGGSYGPGGKGIVFSGYGGYRATADQPATLPYWDTTERIYSMTTSGTQVHAIGTSPTGYDPTVSPDGKSVLYTQRSGTTTNIMRVNGTSATSPAAVLIKNASQADWQPIP